MSGSHMYRNVDVCTVLPLLLQLLMIGGHNSLSRYVHLSCCKARAEEHEPPCRLWILDV